MSGYQGYRYQNQRPPFAKDEGWEDDYTRYQGNNSTSAYQAPRNQGNGLSQRRYSSFVDEPQDEEVNDIRNYDPQTPAAIEEEQYPTPESSGGETGYDQFSSEEDDSDDSDTSPPPVTSTKSDDLERYRRRRRQQGTRGGPNGIGNIAHTTYRWASQAAEAVTDSLGRAFRESSPGFLFLCLLISMAVLALCYALGFLTSSQEERPQRPKRSRHPFNLTEDFTSSEEAPWGLYGKLLREEGMATWFDDARRVDDVVAALWEGLPPLEGFVGPPSAVPEGSEPLPVTVTVTYPWGSERFERETAVQRRLRMRSAIDMRSTMRKRAEAYFENFLANRAAVVGRALDEARRFGELVETHLIAPVTIDDGKDGEGNETVVGPEFHADVAAKFGPESEKKRKVDEFAGVVVKNRTNYILSYAGLHLTSRLLEIHQSLFAAARPEPADLPADLKGQASLLVTAKPGDFSVHADLYRAEKAEKDFLADLIKQSTYGKVLATKQLLPLRVRPLDAGKSATRALVQLVDKARELQTLLQSAGFHLDGIKQRLGSVVAAETGAEFHYDYKWEALRPIAAGQWGWVEAAGDLVESWGRVVEEVAEALRANEEEARELLEQQKKKKRDEDMKAAVAKWRVDHCARASCYGDIVPVKPAVISDEKKTKKQKEGKSLMGWFWDKKAIAGGEEQKADEVKEEVGEAPTEEQKPLSGSGDEAKVTTVCGDVATLEGKAACDRVCCGYSMHNEWADILMYGDRQFTYQDLYSGQPEGALV